LANRSPRRKNSSSNTGSRASGTARAADLLLLAELHTHLPVGLLVNDVGTLEVLHANPPLPGFDRDGPPDRLLELPKDDDEPHVGPELESLIQEVAATGTPQHVPELRHESPEREACWWSATLHRVHTDRWGPVVVTLAVDLTEQVRARRLLAEREARQQTLRQTIVAVPGGNLVLSLQQVTDALVPALPIDVATIRLLDADAKLHLVAASGLRPAEIRRLALEPIPAERPEAMMEVGRLSQLGSLGLHSVEIRWLTGREVGIGTLTIGARTKRRLSDGDLALLDAAAARLGNALEAVERSPDYLHNRSLQMARLSAPEEEAGHPARGLRPREAAILRLYGEGLGTAQIAELLVLSPHTVRTHVRNARRRLGVSSRREALDVLEAIDPRLGGSPRV
jgi:DNA-binding CsgD family transcriptional regulator/PAS domain-containing protein